MSTFDTFTQLPLFKEIEKERLFSLIPKISLDFDHFKEKEPIFSRQSPVNGLIYLLQGKAAIRQFSEERVLEGPALLSWRGVFGQENRHEEDAWSLSNCNTLTIDKRSLIYLIRTEPTFLEAYVGMLSDACQLHYPTH